MKERGKGMHQPRSWDARLWQGLGYIIWTMMLLISLQVLPVLTDTAPENMPSFYVLFIVLLLTAYIVPMGRLGSFSIMIEAILWWLWVTPEDKVREIGTQFFELIWGLFTFASSGETWRAFFIMPAVRTLLFGLGVAAFISYLVKPLFLTYRVLVLGLFPLLLITVTDTFFPYDGRIAASTVFILLILLVVWQTIGRQLFYYPLISTQDAIVVNHRRMDRTMKGAIHPSFSPVSRLSLGGRWFFVAAVLLVLFGFVGYVSPKAAPAWPDPVPFLTSLKGSLSSANEWMGRSSMGRGSGLREDDRHLGGPFLPLDKVMFEARRLDGERNTYHYWRMETKDTYTGGGWQSRDVHALTHYTSELKTASNMAIVSAADAMLARRNDKVWLFDFRQGNGHLPYFPTIDDDVLKTLLPFLNTFVEEVKFNGFTNHIFYDGLLQKVGIPENQFSQEPMLMGDEESGALRGESMSRYMISGYRVPFDWDATMIDTIMERYRPVSDQRGDFFRWYQETLHGDTYVRYTQLPDTVPERVRSLTHQLVAKARSPYEAAKAIEKYLSENRHLSYETDDVPYVGKDEDFVDQFLFQSHRGYCDHFSTSMVVMLREVGIPARWVKGFAPGTMQHDASGQVVTVVRARDAHAWVEAYMPGLGWWPFEPTPSFVDRLNQTGLVDEQQTSPTDAALDEGTLPKDRLERPSPSAQPSVQEDSKTRETFAPTWWETLWGLVSSGSTNRSGGEKPFIADGARVIGYALVGAMLALIALMLTMFSRQYGWAKRSRAGSMAFQQRVLSKHIERLFRTLEKRYGKRAPTMSARDYVAMIKDPNVKERYIQFVRTYEAWRYHPYERSEKTLALETSISKVKMELHSVTERRKLKNEL